jgi:outer membrane protein OmpA-like peptidoglycan-associated protein
MRKALLLSLLSVFVMSGCVTADDPQRQTKKGAAIGAAAGAIAGAIIGHQSDNQRTGAVIGGIVGAVAGSAVGRRMDEQERELQQIEGIEVTRPSENELTVTLNNSILFDYNSAELRRESRVTLAELAGVFHRFPETSMVVEGHTDWVGSEGFNQALSERRAASVASDLISRGVDPWRIEGRGWGKSRPIATNETPEGRQLNRRVEIRIVSTEELGAATP